MLEDAQSLSSFPFLLLWFIFSSLLLYSSVYCHIWAPQNKWNICLLCFSQIIKNYSMYCFVHCASKLLLATLSFFSDCFTTYTHYMHAYMQKITYPSGLRSSKNVWTHKLWLVMKKWMGRFANHEHLCSSELNLTQLSWLYQSCLNRGTSAERWLCHLEK